MPRKSVTNTNQKSGSQRATSLLHWFFCAWVLSLAFYNFSENTADPDLWGHTLFGQEMIANRALHKTEPYSWTANHGPWINHEVLAEVALGASHLLLGGTGLWLLTLVTGFATFGLALGLGLQKLEGSSRAFAWAIAALAVVEIAFGFAARPQIFTALFLAVLIWLLRRIHDGKLVWAVALPFLFLLWINTHGGALAGIVLLFGAAGATTLQHLWSQRSKAGASASSPKLLAILWVVFGLSLAALFANPWGAELIRWLIGSVSWYRPEIQEWNPPQLGWDHGPMFILVAITAIALLFSRRKKALWEVGFCVVLAIIALRSVRHTPLFSIAALAILPPHLADVLFRFREHFERLHDSFSRTSVQRLASFVLAIASAATLYASVTIRKEHPFTMEAPRNQYPVTAVKFIHENEIHGNMLAFFDWGEMVLWELPECSPSIDGRLDTCYTRKVISAHWNFYNGEPVDQAALDFSRADLALLPATLVGSANLAKMPGWKAVYADPLAVVLVRNIERFPKLTGRNLPVIESERVLSGREPFPKLNPRLAAKQRAD